MTNSQANLSPTGVPADDLQQVSSSVPVTRVAEALDTIYAGFTEPIPASQLNAAVRTRMARTDLCGSGIGEPVGHDASCQLPDALLDDDTISPLAKMAYWYLKRHGGRARIEDVAVALRSRMTWAHIDDLAATGWVTVPDDPAELSGEPIQFAVHEVAVTAR